MASRRGQPGAGRWWPGGLLLLLLLAGAVVWWVWLDRQRAQVSEYNRIVALVNQGQVDEAIARLEALLPDATPAVRDEATGLLARLYRERGDDPGVAVARAAEYYRRAHALDPAGTTEEQRRLMEALPR